MKKVALSLACVTLLSVMVPISASAKNSYSPTETPFSISSYLTEPLSTTEETPTFEVEVEYSKIRGFGTAAVFVAGIFVGYIVDGIILYTTGQPAANWVASAMREAQRIYLNTFGNVSTIRVTGGGSFGGGSRPF